MGCRDTTFLFALYFEMLIKDSRQFWGWKRSLVSTSAMVIPESLAQAWEGRRAGLEDR